MAEKMAGEEESNDKEHEVKLVAEPLRTLSFCERMRRLLLHCLPLKKWMKDCIISYVDLLYPDPLPPRSNEYLVPEASRKLVPRKHK